MGNQVSIIIPIYCVEQYIERCARSLFEQTLQDIEYIFVNDCTPDRSIDILESILNEYPTRKKQTKILNHDTNRGLAISRQTGIVNATGKYIAHCDSDDWVDINTYKECFDLASAMDADAVFFDFNMINGTTSRHIFRSIPNDRSLLMSSLICGKVMGSLCGFIAKQELYKHVLIYPRYNINEDLVVSLQLINNSNRVEYISKPFYMYVMNPASTTSIHSKEKAITNFWESYYNYCDIVSYLEMEGIKENYLAEMVARESIIVNTLSRYSLDMNVRRLWMRTFNKLYTKVFRNKYLSNKYKIAYYLTLIGLYPIWKRIKLTLNSFIK